MVEIKKITNDTFEVNGVRVTRTDYGKLPDNEKMVFERYLKSEVSKYTTKTIMQ
jgi:hypothetical protein